METLETHIVSLEQLLLQLDSVVLHGGMAILPNRRWRSIPSRVSRTVDPRRRAFASPVAADIPSQNTALHCTGWYCVDDFVFLFFLSERFLMTPPGNKFLWRNARTPGLLLSLWRAVLGTSRHHLSWTLRYMWAYRQLERSISMLVVCISHPLHFWQL